MKRVYMSFSAEMLHYGHIRILEEAAALGELTVGVLTDEAIAQYKRPPLVPFEERRKLFEPLSMVAHIVKKDTASYAGIIRQCRPDIVVHGDDWHTGVKAKFRDELIALLGEYGGELVEFPYTRDAHINLLEKSFAERYTVPEIRRGMLKRLFQAKPFVRVLEAHNGLTGLIAENAALETGGGLKEFDAMWFSSLCDSASRGKPDIELVDWTSKISRLNEIMEVTTKPIIVDGDTGGMIEHFVYNVQTLERIGVSAVIIEDKTGLKKNSLFGTEVAQTQDSIENFCQKIAAGKKVLRTKDFLIIARIESLILEKGLDDALARAEAYVGAGADGILIHSRSRTPDEVFAFCDRFRALHPSCPIVAVPTTYNQIPEEALAAHGIKVIIHANHQLRSAFPAMQSTALNILRDGCSGLSADAACMPIKDVIRIIPLEEDRRL